MNLTDPFTDRELLLIALVFVGVAASWYWHRALGFALREVDQLHGMLIRLRRPK